VAALNHTIVWCSDKARSSQFLTGILGLQPARTFFHFLVVDLDNRVSMDFYQKDGPVAVQHYAFLVSEDDFDAICERIKSRGLTYWADPYHQHQGINHNDGGRGLYWQDPDGHNLEILTVPYGGWPPQR